MNFLNFFKTNYKVHIVEVLSQDPLQAKKFYVILSNLKLRFEPHVLILFSKFLAKDPKKKRYHLNIMNFGVKKFMIKKHPKF